MAPQKGLQLAPALSWPKQWQGNARRARRRAIGFSLLTVALLALALYGYRQQTIDLLFIFAGVGACTLVIALTAWLRSNLDLRRRIDRVELQQASDAIFIPAHWVYKSIYHIASAGILAISATWVYTGMTGGYDGPDRRAFPFYLFAFTVAPVLGVWMAARLSSRLFFRLRGPRMGIRITPNGVAQTTLWGEVEQKWTDIESIIITHGDATTFWRRKTKADSSFLVILRPTGRARRRLKGNFPYLPVTDWRFVRMRAAIIEVAELDVYAPVVPHLLTFYFEHPELRHELGTEKALERVRTGDFVA